MRILISGGGLAGLTLAYWLDQYGFTPVVIEKAPDLRRDGYGIDFFGTGYDVAKRMGIIDALARRKLHPQYVGYVEDDGTLIARLDIDLMQRVMHGKYMALMHGTLEEELYATVRERVAVRFGRTLTAVAQTADAVTVTFDDGASERFDLLIGADGIHSNTRSLVFGPEARYGHYLGYYVASYKLPDRYGIGHTWQNYTEPGRQVGAYCSDKEGEIITLFMWEAPDEGAIPREQRLSRLREAFAGMGWIAPQLLNDIPEPHDIFMDTVTQIEMPRWYDGRVALVGDACSCLTLISGQGASMALGGAYLLATALQETAGSPRQAFRHYEVQLRPHIEARQGNARDFAKAFVPGSELGLKVQKVMMKILLRDAFKGVLRRQFGAESILQAPGARRLPQSSGQVIGYAIADKLHPTDYETLMLDTARVLEQYDSVHLLLRLDHFAGVDLQALWDDLKFGREYGRDVSKLALVGDDRWSRWLATASRPFYAQAARHFALEESDAAWQWLRE